MYAFEMASSSTPTQERSVITRAGLLTAVVDCLVKTGYASASIRGVADRAGASPGAVQHHFGTRDQMIVEATEFIYGELVDQLEGISERDFKSHDPDEQARELVTALWHFYGSELNTAINEIVIGARPNPSLHQQITRLRERIVAAYMAPWMKLLAGTRLTDADKKDLLQFAISNVRGLALFQYYEKRDSQFFSRQQQMLANVIANAISMGVLRKKASTP